MPPIQKHGVVVCVISFCVVTLLAASCGKSPSYLEFMGRDQKYFAELAEACDQILTRTNITAQPTIIDPKDASLPDCIRNLHPSTIKAVKCHGESNCVTFVWIMIGVSRPGFGIKWMENDYGNGKRVWELSTGADGLGKIVYSKQ